MFGSLILLWAGAASGAGAITNSSISGDPLVIGASQSAVNSWSSNSGGKNKNNQDNDNQANWATISGGIGNSITAEAQRGFIGGGSGNLIAGPGACVIAGGSGNAILDDAYLSFIGGGIDNVISNAAAYSYIGGGGNCLICSNAVYSFMGNGINLVIYDDVAYSGICGGAGNLIFNDTQYAFIGGGYVNKIGTNSPHCVITGGGLNSIGSLNEGAFIGGGTVNDIQANSSGAVIGGGTQNYVGNNAPNATVSGGTQNQVFPGAANAAIPGGIGNAVYGQGSLAAGSRVAAVHDGTFVWGDASTGTAGLYTTGPNQFVVRASGGIWLGTNNSEYIPPGHFLETQTGAYLTSAGCWSTCSDRNAKRNFRPVNPAEILEKVMNLPLSSWSYRAEAPSVRHLGPVAQDFRAAFGLGEDERHISSVDEEGVALAAVQGLYQKVKEKDAEVAALQKQIAGLEHQLTAQQQAMNAWEDRLATIEQAVARDQHPSNSGFLNVSAHDSRQ